MQNFIQIFWRKKGILNYLLLIFSLIIYLFNLIKKNYSRPKKAKAFIICVGNVTVGGAGKTPIAIAIAKILIAQRHQIAFVSRGYKGLLSTKYSAVKVDPSLHSALEVGDEPLMLAQVAPTYVCIDRYLAAKAAIKDGAKIIILDDGLQNYTLIKDLSILVIDTHYGIGNGMMMPAGPLREPLSSVLKKVDYVLINQNTLNELKLGINKPIFNLTNKTTNSAQLKNRTFIALCGIANPQKFFDTLKNHNITLIKKFIFPDHHLFSSIELNEIIESANKHNCKIITTTKDLIRINKIHHHWFETVEIEAIIPHEFQKILLKKILE